MARTANTPTPTLTPNNRIYLYRLLSQALGCGKQTFLPAVEEALKSDRMTAEDLGFESTRELLEALDEFVKLTIFKGGRIYATVIAQPAWDEALAVLDSGKAATVETGGKTGKPWKRKKADKTLKPVRPKRVKRPEPSAPQKPPLATKATPDDAATINDGAAHADVGDREPVHSETPEAGNSKSREHMRTQTSETAFEVEEAEGGEPSELTVATETRAASRKDPFPASDEPEAAPAISLTVTYDPYSGIDKETKLESHPAKTESAVKEDPATVPVSDGTALPTHSSQMTDPAAEAESTAAIAPNAALAPALKAPAQGAPAVAAEPDKPKTSPEILATYPEDFSCEVYLASERVADLCELLPYGTDVFTLLAEDYARARVLELIEGTRARATFPLRIQHADSVDPIMVTLKKRSGQGLQWELARVR